MNQDQITAIKNVLSSINASTVNTVYATLEELITTAEEICNNTYLTNFDIDTSETNSVTLVWFHDEDKYIGIKPAFAMKIANEEQKLVIKIKGGILNWNTIKYVNSSRDASCMDTVISIFTDPTIDDEFKKLWFAEINCKLKHTLENVNYIKTVCIDINGKTPEAAIDGVAKISGMMFK